MTTANYRAVQFVLIASCVGFFTACSPSWWFDGRILIFNYSSDNFQSLTMIVDEHETELLPTAVQQACWQKAQANRSLAFRWRTKADVEFEVIKPISELVPKNTRDDLVVEIFGPSNMKATVCKLPKVIAGLQRRS